jgi:hypothetical protein
MGRNDEATGLLVSAQQGDKNAEFDLINLIRTNYMPRRLSKYLSRNRQAENDDLRQEFLIGVALKIYDARLDIGDPIEFLIAQGLYRVRSYLRKCIRANTMQICELCGTKSRLNPIGHGRYQCLHCGATSPYVQTTELADKNEIIFDNLGDYGFEDELILRMRLHDFESSLTPGSNVERVYIMLKDGVDRDNPLVNNYIQDIAHRLGGCSNQNVVQIIKKLRVRLDEFLKD